MQAKNRKPTLIMAMVFCWIFITGILNYTFEAVPAISSADNQFELNTLEDAYPQDWNWTWDGGKQDVARALASDSNNNIYLVGYTNSIGTGASDVILIKFDSSGNKLMERQWGGTGSDQGHTVALDSSGNIYIGGSTFILNNPNHDAFLLKYSPEGNLLWVRLLQGTGAGSDTTYGVAVDNSQNIYITGILDNTDEDIFLAKYTTDGDQVWNKTYDYSAYDWGHGVAISSTNYVYIVGSYGLISDRDVFLLRTDSSGNELGLFPWGTPNNDYGWELALDSNNNIYIAGGRNGDACVVKFDATGNELWNTSWGGAGLDGSKEIAIDSSNNVFIAGDDTTTSQDGFLRKMDSSGNLLWNFTWGGANTEYFWGLITDSNDNVYVAGETNSFSGTKDVILFKYGTFTGPGRIPGFQFVFLLLPLIIIVSIIILKRDI
jgi:uncharacterized delta-60 repeat protein